MPQTRRTPRLPLLTAVALAATILLAAPAHAAAGWKPAKPVEIVVMAGQGGGADKLVRFIQSLIEKHNLAEVAFIASNKGGGSGAEALRYMKQKAGDEHVLMATLNSVYTTPLRRPDLGVDMTAFTPIARLAQDTFVLWVNADSPITTLDQYVRSVKGKGARWRMGGTGSGQEDSLITAMLERGYDIKMTYVPFRGGGDVAVNLAGKRIDSSVNNPAEAMSFLQAGKVRPLAALTAHRIPALKDVPTMKELGRDLTYAMQRTIVAPSGISAEAAAYYTAIFERVYVTPEWQDYCRSAGLECAWMSGHALKEDFLAQARKHQALLRQPSGGR